MAPAMRILRRPASALVKPGAQKQKSIKCSAQKKAVIRCLPPKKHKPKVLPTTFSKAPSKPAKMVLKAKASGTSVPSTPNAGSRLLLLGTPATAKSKVRSQLLLGTSAPTTPKARARVEPSTPPKKVAPVKSPSLKKIFPSPVRGFFMKKAGSASASSSKSVVERLQRVCQTTSQTKGVGDSRKIKPKSMQELTKMSLVAVKKVKNKFAKRALKHKRLGSQQALDPIAALRKKYDKLIPKKPISAYHLFIADDSNQNKAREALKDYDRHAMDTSTSQQAKLADMWKSLTPTERAPYERWYTKETLVFEKKNQVWQKTEAFRKIDLLESKQKEARMSEKRAKKDAEEKEIQELLEGGVVAKPGRGLLEGRTAIITGVQSPESLNGKEVSLEKFVRVSDSNGNSTERWIVKPVDTIAVDPAWPQTMRAQPSNLIWTVLAKQAKKEEEARKQARQREKEEALKKERREIEKAARDKLREEEEALKKVQRDIDKIAKAEENEAHRLLRESELQAVKDAHKALQDSAKEQRRNAEIAARAVKENQEGLQRAIKEATKAAFRVFEGKTTAKPITSEMSAEMADAECLD